MKSHTKIVVRLLTLIATLAVLGAGLAVASSSRQATVTIKNFAYMPRQLTVSVGTTVTFTNHDTTNHTITADKGSFNVSNLAPGHSAKIKFTHAGTFSYHCTFHPFMHGTIVVR